jgi:N-acetyl-gamma-glutamyl-phosphate reductase
MTRAVPTIILGGSGYVAGELLRLVLAHPQLAVAGVMSESQAGGEVSSAFPHLRAALGDLKFQSREEVLERFGAGPLALLSAAPHGASAALLAGMIGWARQQGTKLTVVDVSADFRFPSAGAYEAVYKHAHGAPDLLGEFACAVPEHLPATSRPHIAHPGCFATAMLLAAVPLVRLELTEPDLFATGVTGSTGAGRTPIATTHHPERHANLFAYQPLAHRHAPEVMGICEQLTGTRPRLHFVPHSGPFARGIHMTVQGRLRQPTTADALRSELAAFYEGSEFVTVVDGMPRLKDIVGSNYAHVGVTVDADSAAVMVVEDNLVKGAAGGAVQWLNRKLGFAENAGLTTPASGWV